MAGRPAAPGRPLLLNRPPMTRLVLQTEQSLCHAMETMSIMENACDFSAQSCDKTDANATFLARRGLSLNRVASFIAIADASGVSAAAQGDATRRSQLGWQLKEDDEFFGRTLVDRKRDAFRVTRQGR